ncbi:MAG TPA: glyceraldehyde 3-phosphate dehydrogenase NAD-binding domain-containing protein, partial [Candidatus Polarisedimenticolia bacterium]|nr:glyceraldehyde 3-phosphate dehydrogenase NAD-binding domain-containing protein [Candidatus Polarisedimenticolia bacterium]
MPSSPHRIAINGFGRVGRLALRAGLGRTDLEFVAVNDLSDPDLVHYLFAHDSVHGPPQGTVSRDGDYLVAGSRRVLMLRRKNPTELPWKDLGVDVVIECTGAFRSRSDSARHLEAGAR